MTKSQDKKLKLPSFLFEGIVENIEMPVFLKDEQHNFLFANNAFFNLIGIKKEELFDLNHTIELFEDDSPLLNDIDVIEGGTSTVTKEIIKHKEGGKYLCTVQRNLLRVTSHSNYLMCTIKKVEEYRNHATDFDSFFRKRYKYIREIINLLPNIVLIKDVQNNYHFINTAAQKVFGVDTDKVIGQEAIESSNLGRYSHILTKRDSEVLETGMLLNFEPQSLTCQSTQDTVSYQFTKIPIHGFHKEIIGIIVIGTDVTKHVEIERILKEKEILFQLVVDNIPQHIFWKNRESVYISGNKNFVNVAKLNAVTELSGLTDFDLPWKERAPVLRKIDEEVMVSGKAMINMEQPIIRTDGEKIWLRTNKIPLRNANKEIIGLLGTFEDITKSKEAESALKDSEFRYRLLFEHAFDGILVYDMDAKKVVECNRKTLDFLNLESINDFNSKSILELSPEYQLNGKRTAETMYYYFGKIKEERTYSFDWLLRSANGKRLHTEVQGVYLESKGRQLLTMIFKDVTKRKEQEKIISNSVDALNEKNEKLEKYIQSNMQLENFAYIASHDLKTPLRSIISFSELLKRSLKDGRLTTDEQEFLDYILLSGKNMQRLINDLLTYSKVNTEQYNLDIVNIESLIQGIKRGLHASIVEQKARIVINEMPTAISADITKMHQLFQNIIANAIKFHKPNELPVITISAEEYDEHWLFSIKDNGIGIKKEFRDKIFLLFRKLHSASKYEGTGIGLAVCKTIVEQHGGRIWVESTYGEGTTFHFTIAKNLD